MAQDYNDIVANNIGKKDAQKKATVYSSERINDIIEDYKHGLSPDMSPFYMGDINRRDAKVLFKYTPEEIEEIERCSDDCVYFVEKYCKFLTDKGRVTVDLRDYQKDILKLMSEVKWDSSLEEFVPLNRFLILLQSRQSGKCVEGHTDVIVTKEFAEKVYLENKKKYSLKRYFKRALKDLCNKIKAILAF